MSKLTHPRYITLAVGLTALLAATTTLRLSGQTRSQTATSPRIRSASR